MIDYSGAGRGSCDCCR